jgi:flagellar assembly protein FliH
MPLIKSVNAPAQVATFSLTDIERQARAIIAAAQLRADRLLIAAQQEAEEIKRRTFAETLVEGRKDGHAKGLEEGRKQGRDEALNEQRQQLTQVVAALTQGVQDLEAARLQLDTEAREAVVRLAVTIAERVTKRQGALDPQVAIANVEEALRLVVHSADVRIAIHPSQQAALADVLPRIQAQWPDLKHVDLITDPSLAPGGCRVYSGAGHIDGDLDLQLTRIAEELLPNPQEPAQP